MTLHVRKSLVPFFAACCIKHEVVHAADDVGPRQMEFHTDDIEPRFIVFHFFKKSIFGIFGIFLARARTRY